MDRQVARRPQSERKKHPKNRAEAAQPPQPIPLGLDYADIFHLQRLIGNRATQRVLARHRALPASASPRLLHSQPFAQVDHAAANRVQRFTESEHKYLGDLGEEDPDKVQKVRLADGYYITYGEMVAMGDHFKSIEQMREFAANPGPGVGTREEIEYVRVVQINGKKGEKDKFSEEVRKSADKRYYTLAGGNVMHFVNPRVGDESRSVDDKASDIHREKRLEWEGLIPRLVESVELPNSAVAYRKYHMQALYEAYFAGLEGKDFDSALAAEAFGAHFLTDSFSSGHLRTKRADIMDHWNAQVPMFNFNLKGYISEKLAEILEKDPRMVNIVDNKYIQIGTRYQFFSEDMVYSQTLPKVTAILDSKGFLTFGDVVSGAIHDYDNKRGVLATIEGKETRLFGDSHLHEGDTATYAIEAVSAGHNEVIRAWNLGKKGESPLAVIESLLKDKLFAPERLLPQVKPDSDLEEKDKSVKWDYADVDSLLADKQFKEAFQLFAKEKAGEFASAKGELDDEAQKDAMQTAVIDPLLDASKSLQVLKAVINWTPDTGGGVFGHNQDDNALDYYEKAKADGSLAKISLTQKKALVRNLLEGATVGDDEDAIMDILKTDDGDARAIIKEFGWSRLEDDIDDWFGSEFADTFPKREYGR